MGHLRSIQQSSHQARPQTSSGAFMRKKKDEDIFGLDDTTQDDMDKELNEMIRKNQERLAELQSDMKEVNKIAGEPVVNVRKLKQRIVKPANPILGQKTLNIKSPSASRSAMGDEIIDG